MYLHVASLYLHICIPHVETYVCYVLLYVRIFSYLSVSFRMVPYVFLSFRTPSVWDLGELMRSHFGTMPPRKKPRLLRAVQAIGLNVPLTAISRLKAVFDVDGDSDSDDDAFVYNASISVQLREIISSTTSPYGNLIQQWRLPASNGDVVVWDVFSPFALMWVLCVRAPQFASLLYSCCHEVECKLAIWHDETTCGNKLRPDAHRKFVALYWTLVDMPEWWRSTDFGWLPVGFLSYDTLKLVSADVSGVIKQFLRECFLHRRNFADGIELPHPVHGRWTLRARVSCVLADEKAHKELNAVKGVRGNTRMPINGSAVFGE